MARTDKDAREFKFEHWMSIYTPSWFNKQERRRQRTKARQDMQKGREPLPDYGDEYYW